MPKKYEILNIKTGERIEVKPGGSRYKRMARRIIKWAELIEKVYDADKHRMVMLTLTYSPGVDWRPNHIRDLRAKYIKLLDRNILGYAWCAELQKRGAVHYHLIMVVKKGTDIPMPDLAGLWEFGSTNIITARSPFYIVTYLGKSYQKDFTSMPKGIRIFAVWVRQEYFPVKDYWIFRLSSLPKWLDEIISPIDDWCGIYPRRVRGVGWCLRIPRHMRRGIYKKYNVFRSDWIYDWSY